MASWRAAIGSILFGCVVASLPARMALSSSIELLQDDRRVTSIPHGPLQPPSPPFGEYFAGIDTVLLLTYAQADRQWGHGELGVFALESPRWEGDALYHAGEVVHDVTFSVTQPVALTFDADLEYYGGPGIMEFEVALNLDGAPVFELSSPDPMHFGEVSQWGGRFESVDYTGMLTPGIYQLVLGMRDLGDAGGAPWSAQGYFYFDMQIVPEPSTAALLTLGLALTSALRRRTTLRSSDRPWSERPGAGSRSRVRLPASGV